MDETVILVAEETCELIGKKPHPHRVRKLYVSLDMRIDEFDLSGKQTLGRATAGSMPDIAIASPFVSRHHGYFEVTEEGANYTAEQTTNGTFLNGEFVAPGQTVALKDGDRLCISVKKGNREEEGVVFNCAFTEERSSVFRSLISAAQDDLTGVSTREVFRGWFAQKRSENALGSACLFVLDVDHFKNINDSYGHISGDHALSMLGKEILELLLDKYSVCRWGGDEFVGVIFLPAEEAKEAMLSLCKKISEIKIDGQYRMTVSAGLADLGRLEPDVTLDDVIGMADKALYYSKESGRNTVSVYHG